MLVYIIIQCMYTRMLYTVLLDLCTDMAIYSTAVADMNTGQTAEICEASLGTEIAQSER